MNCAARGCLPPQGGTRRAHCGACHESFTGLTAFDRHQTINHGSHCHDPAERGLVQRPDGVWRSPGEIPEGTFPPSGVAQNGRTPAPGTHETREALEDAQEDPR